jgi:hypothetical protein
VAERAVWLARIVIDAPGFDLGACVLERRELVDVQAFVTQASVEGFAFPRVCRVEWTARANAQSSNARDMNSVP